MTEISKNAKVPQCNKTTVSGSVTVRDLRIGNCIKIKEDSFHFQEILQINRGSICIEEPISDEFVCVDILDVEPIKISKEWLEKLGFKFVIRNMWELKIDFYTKLQFYENQDDYITLFIQNYNNGERVSDTHLAMKNIKYIHQLQNLFFDLTGRDLTDR